ncbi:AsmA protein [Modicisalibacter muralis]|uniref:AsmA protein n=1 Tax=Modicisalibacter muralis TaxID=119000 RepID=A0A1G9QEE2_9GAMM|nr:AsmA family protein [Halomonas muralis]SDM09346.1 AsmA protein [Halomonas muralis]
MKRLMRMLLATIGVLGLVVVGAVVYVTTFFDPNDLKPRLIEAVQQQSGLELALEGPLNWSFYPRLGVSVEDARAWLPQQPHDQSSFAAIERAEVSLAFAPLLSGEIAIDGLTLTGMRLNLVRDEQGRGNWEVLLERLNKQGEQAEAALAPASAGPSMQGGGPDVALDIASVQVRDSEVHYADLRSGLDVSVKELSLTGTNVNPANAFPLEASFVIDSAAPSLTSDVSLQSQVRLSLNDNRYVLEGLTLETQTHLAGLEDREQTISLEAERAVAELGSGHYLLEGAQLNASLDHPALGESPLPLGLTLAAEADLEAQTARVSDLRLSGDNGLELTGKLSFTELLTTPSYTGQVKLAPLSLRPWLERFGVALNTANDEALSEVAIVSPIEGDLEQATLTDLTLTVDDTTFTGRLGAGLGGRSLTFDLQGDRLDLDAYLPPPVEGAEAPADDSAALLEVLGVAPAYAATEAAELVPVEALRNLSLDGQLALDELKVKGITLLSPTLAIAGSDGRHRLESFDARLYDGTLNVTAALDVREKPIRWRFSEALDNVQIVPLVEAYSGEPSPLRGLLTLNGEFTSQTSAADTLLRNLDGQANLHVDDGAVFDVNVSQELCTAVAMLEGESASREWSPDTSFERLEASVTVTDGVARNDDLLITIPGIELSGEGQLNLPTQRFAYDARARFVDTADAACEVNPRLERVPLPVHCEGMLSGEPSQWCSFDREAFQQALGELAKDELKSEAVERIGEELDERVGEETSKELKDALRGLFE